MTWPPSPKDFADAVGVLVRENFGRDRFLAPVAFVFATLNPDTRERVEPALLTFVLMGAPSSFASQLRAFAREVDANMLLQAYEVRMVGALSEQPSRGYERLASAPDARDYIVMFLEERRSGTTLAWLAPIDESGALHPFEQVPVGRVDGWLTAVLDLVS